MTTESHNESKIGNLYPSTECPLSIIFFASLVSDFEQVLQLNYRVFILNRHVFQVFQIVLLYILVDCPNGLHFFFTRALLLLEMS